MVPGDSASLEPMATTIIKKRVGSSTTDPGTGIQGSSSGLRRSSASKPTRFSNAMSSSVSLSFWTITVRCWPPSGIKRGGFSDREIGEFIIPERTQRHRKAQRKPLSIEESDRLVRMTRIQALAEDVFGEAKNANRWLREGLGILGGKSPLEVARTDAGARVVEQILAKIDWGAAA